MSMESKASAQSSSLYCDRGIEGTGVAMALQSLILAAGTAYTTDYALQLTGL
jgi:hypothetical protein